MINQQLLDYIKQQLAAGHDKQTVKEALLNAGWAEQDVNETFDFFFTSSHPAQQPAQQPFAPPQPALAGSTFLGPTKLLSNAWALYRQRFWTLIAVALMPTLVIIAAIVASTFGVSSVSTFIFSKIITSGPYSLIPIAALFVLVVLAMFLVQIWGQAALLFAIVNNQEGIGVAQSYRRSWHKILSLCWIAILVACVVFGGFLLAIVPGVIFAVWFGFSTLVLIAEDSKGMDALLKSREYVRGRWGAVLGRNAFIALLGFVAYLIPNILFSIVFKAPLVLQVVNAIILTAWLPLTIAYMFLMYQNLRSLRGEVDLAVARKSRATFIVIAFLGIALVLALLYWVASPTLNIVGGPSLNNPGNYVQTTPTPTAFEETAGWQTYRNEKYGFEIKYPGDWIKEEDNTYPFGIRLMREDFQANRRDLMITIDPINVGRESVFDAGKSNLVSCTIKNISFGGRESKECIAESIYGYSRYVRVIDLTDTKWEKDNEISFALNLEGGISSEEYHLLLPIYNQILSTFKFIK